MHLAQLSLFVALLCAHLALAATPPGSPGHTSSSSSSPQHAKSDSPGEGKGKGKQPGISSARMKCGLAGHSAAAACKTLGQAAVMPATHLAAGAVGAVASGVRGLQIHRSKTMSADEKTAAKSRQRTLASARVRTALGTGVSDGLINPTTAASHVVQAARYAKQGIQDKAKARKGKLVESHDQRKSNAGQYEAEKQDLREQNGITFGRSTTSLRFEAGLSRKNPSQANFHQ